jgi:hypothetical protein
VGLYLRRWRGPELGRTKNRPRQRYRPRQNSASPLPGFLPEPPLPHLLRRLFRRGCAPHARVARAVRTTATRGAGVNYAAGPQGKLGFVGAGISSEPEPRRTRTGRAVARAHMTRCNDRNPRLQAWLAGFITPGDRGR